MVKDLAINMKFNHSFTPLRVQFGGGHAVLKLLGLHIWEQCVLVIARSLLIGLVVGALYDSFKIFQFVKYVCLEEKFLEERVE